MAQKVSIILVDDIDGSEAVETVSFGLDGSNYEIDLNEEHAAQLREAFAAYVGHARKVAASGGRRASSRRSSGSGVDTKAVREWARANGHEVSERGRVPASLVAAYEAAN